MPTVVLDGIVLRGEVPYARHQLEGVHLPWVRSEPAGSVTPANPVISDTVTQFVPWDRVARRQWTGWSPPTWDPYAGLGAPVLGNPQQAILDPVRVVALIVDDRHGPAVRAWLRLMLAGLFAFGFLRSLGVGRPGALLGAAGFEIGGFLIPWLGHPHAGVAMYLPAFLWAGDAVFRGRRRAAVPLAIVFAAQFFAGHPQTSLHVLTIAVLYWFVRHALSRRWITIALALAAGGLLAAPVLVPFVSWLGRSAAISLRSDAPQLALPWSATATFVWPRVFGWPVGGAWRGPINANEIVAFCGVVPWLLLPFAFRRSPRTALAFALVGAAGLAMACRLPGVDHLVQSLPGFRWAANRRMVLAVAFAVCALGAMGLGQVGERSSTRAWWVSVGIAVLGLGLVYGAIDDPIAALRAEPWSAMIGGAVILAALALIRGLSQGRVPPAGRWALVGLIVIELGVNWARYQPTAPREALFATMPSIAAIQAHARPEDRVLALSARRREDVFPPNTLHSFGLGTLLENDALGNPALRARWADAMAPSPDWPRKTDPFGARFIASTVPLERAASAARIFPGQDHVAVFPRRVSDPGGPAVPAILVDSYLVGGERYPQGTEVGTLTVRGTLPDGSTRDRSFPMRIGVETAEGALPQFGARVPHRAPPVARVFSVRDHGGDPYTRFVYRWRVPWMPAWGRPFGARVSFRGPDGFLELEGFEAEGAVTPIEPDWVGELYVYRNRSAWPRAFTAKRGALAGDGALAPVRAARIVAFGGARVVIEGDAGADEILVSSDAADGWRATVNGRPADVRVVDELFRGVDVPAGSFRVTFTYAPRSVAIGWWCALAGFVCVGLLAGLTPGRRRRERS